MGNKGYLKLVISGLFLLLTSREMGLNEANLPRWRIEGLAPQSDLEGRGSSQAQGQEGGRIDINSATEEQLSELFRPIVPDDRSRRGLVERIIQNRPYQIISDLLKVPGIGKGRLQEIQKRLAQKIYFGHLRESEEQGKRPGEKLSPQRGVARFILVAHGDPRDVPIWETMFSDFISKAPHAIFLQELGGASISPIKERAKELGISVEEFLNNPQYRSQLEYYFNKTKAEYTDAFKNPQQAMNLLNELITTLPPMPRARMQYLLETVKLLNRFKVTHIIVEDVRFEVWLEIIKGFIEGLPDELFRKGDIEGYLSNRENSSKRSLKNITVRNQDLANQIERELAQGKDVIAHVGLLHWQLPEVLKSRGHTVETSQVIRPEDFGFEGEFLYRIMKGEEVPHEMKALFLLKDFIDLRFRIYLEQREDTRSLFKRTRALTGLWRRQDIMDFSHQYQRLATRENDGYAFMRYYLQLALLRYVEERNSHIGQEDVIRIAERVDQSFLTRFRNYLSAFSLLEQEEQISQLIYNWLLNDQQASGGVWITEEEQLAIAGRVDVPKPGISLTKEIIYDILGRDVEPSILSRILEQGKDEKFKTESEVQKFVEKNYEELLRRAPPDNPSPSSQLEGAI